MNPQRLAQFGALLAWGGWSGWWWLALLLALLLEYAHWVGWRWSLRDREFDQLTNASVVAILVTLGYAILTQGAHGVLWVIGWLPLLLFPLFAAQRYSRVGTIQLGSLFLSLRRRRDLGDPVATRRVDLAASYIALCLLSAATLVVAAPLLFPVVALIAALALLPQRSRRYPRWIWGGTLLLTLAIAHFTHQGIYALQDHVEGWMLQWLEDLTLNQIDPFERDSMMGRVGRLKLSERIVWQVDAEPSLATPQLLPRASYQHYNRETWSTLHRERMPVPYLRGAEGWALYTASQQQPATLHVYGRLRGGEGLLPLPAGARSLYQLPAARIERNVLGTLMVAEAPHFVGYRVDFDPAQRYFPPPEEEDLELSLSLHALLAPTIDHLGLRDVEPEAALAILERFFREEFRYTLFRREMRNDLPPLQDFLEHNRNGHCEYFASASALLLRAIGIPTRYVTGFAVVEPSALGDSFVVRRRHAHAWAIAHLNGAWQVVDFTPAEWVDLEEQAAPWWNIVGDLWMLLYHTIQRNAMEGAEGERDQRFYYGILLLLLALLGHRLYRRPRRQRTTPPRASGPAEGVQTIPSPLQPMIAALQRQGHPYLPGETTRQWVQRLQREQVAAVLPVAQALPLHYRLRFHPTGLRPDQQQRLATLVEQRMQKK